MKIVMMGALAKKRYFPTDFIDTEVWGLNAIYQPWVPRWDRRFNLHKFENLTKYKWKDKYFDAESDFSENNPQVPFYTMDEWPGINKLVGWQQFPFEDMMANMIRGNYHAGSFDWMVAFAIWLNQEARALGGPGQVKPPVDEIEIHGVALNMEAGEPISARACLEYWCGRAEGEGITVTLAGDAHLFEFYHMVRSNLIYSVDDTPVIEDQDRADITGRLAQKEAPYDYEE